MPSSFSSSRLSQCHYVTLQVSPDASPDSLRRSYRRLALRHHPDRNFGHEAEAGEQFRCIQEAFEVLNDPQEREWYNRHRERLLRHIHIDGDKREMKERDKDKEREWEREGEMEELLGLFTMRAFSGFNEEEDVENNFFSLYSRVFAQIDHKERVSSTFRTKRERKDEREEEEEEEEEEEGEREGEREKEGGRPDFGSSKSPPAAVRAFYSYWTNFLSQRSFIHKDKWQVDDAPNRQYRRAMDVENKKERAKARKEFSELVRSLALFVRKRDPRMHEMERVQRQIEAKQTEERAARIKEDKLRREQDKARHAEDQAKRWKEQERERREIYGEIDAEERAIEARKQHEKSGTDFECVLCRKIFKSEKQWNNHEQSKKHKQMVAQHVSEISLPCQTEDSEVLIPNQNSCQQGANIVEFPQPDNAYELEGDQVSELKLNDKFATGSVNLNIDGLTRAEIGDTATQQSVSDEQGDTDCVDDMLPSTSVPRAKKAARKRAAKLRSRGFNAKISFAHSMPSNEEKTEHSEPVQLSYSVASEQNVCTNGASEQPTESFTDNPPKQNVDVSSTLEDDQASSKKNLSTKDKRKVRALKKQADVESKMLPKDSKDSLRCVTCKSVFASRTKLYTHLKEKNHAAPL